ncbi:NAD-dependent epimerase/dehydratase [Metarhizium album ARSEF 1941]|uniref:NAD-dependent epimerase/dehydratase n=1 Tax=Metarhizium album (strain ARSEF 1941) TaxID=1081103 RepID=A0A0B2WMW2_METAS|nr:NAD-dependent epimerase/dehydratase [Metarhizium album ARSEF 1941]KHN95034.1 NAD-dependent epimerase/dehydratase [Metarhizium album ARSEF 1941]
MLVTVAPASTKTGTAVIRSLLTSPDAGVDIQAIYRDTAKAPVEFTTLSNFKAVQGDIADGASLNLDGSDVVVAITPPVFDSSDIVATARQRSENVKNAIEKAGTVKKLILLSSIGAQFSSRVVRLVSPTRRCILPPPPLIGFHG